MEWDTCNGTAILDETFLTSPVEIGPMVDGRLFGWSTPENRWFPRVEMGVEVND